MTAATLCIAIVGVISGLFGMNLHNTHEDSYQTFILVRYSPSPCCCRSEVPIYVKIDSTTVSLPLHPEEPEVAHLISELFVASAAVISWPL